MKTTKISGRGDMLTSIDRSVFFTASGLIVLFCFLGGVLARNLLFLRKAAELACRKCWLVLHFSCRDFLRVYCVSRSKPLCKYQTWPDDSKPDYSYQSWIAMLFSAGVGIGLLFFGC